MISSRLRSIKSNYELYLLVLVPIVYFVVFKYWPMYGIQIAFKNFSPAKGIWGSHWAGLKYFSQFLHAYNFTEIIKNTVFMSGLNLLIAFPLPILIALLLSQVKREQMKKFIQTTIYAPYFISTVVLVGMMFIFFAPSGGPVNNLIEHFGGKPILFMGQSAWFRPLYIFSTVWQETGFASVIYLAALSGIDPHLHEAAVVDGASKWRRILHIDLPGIAPTIVVLFILAIGNLMNVGFEKAFLMQSDLNTDVSEIIPTYVYKIGIQQANYSFSAAIGLFNALINLILLITVNRVAKKVSGSGLI